MDFILKRDLIKQKLEIVSRHDPWWSISKFSLCYHGLKKMFENTRSWVMIGTYIQSREILENGLNKKLKTYQVIHFYTLNPY